MDDKAIEAAAQAARDYIGSCSYGASTTDIVCVAIAAYRDAEIERLNESIKTLLANHQAVRAKLEAAERDAERYRFLKGNFGICRPFDELLIWHADEIDAAIDNAARGGERG